MHTYEITKHGLQSVKKHCDVKHDKLKKNPVCCETLENTDKNKEIKTARNPHQQRLFPVLVFL